MPKVAQQGLMAVGWLVILVMTGYAVIVQPFGLLTPFLQPWSATFTTDLIFELTLICVYIYLDSKRRGRNPWGWIAGAAVLGALATLGYFLVRSRDEDAPPILGGGPRDEASRPRG